MCLTPPKMIYGTSVCVCLSTRLDLQSMDGNESTHFACGLTAYEQMKKSQPLQSTAGIIEDNGSSLLAPCFTLQKHMAWSPARNGTDYIERKKMILECEKLEEGILRISI